MINIKIGIQARFSNTRLPNKAAMEITGKPSLLRLLDTVIKCKNHNKKIYNKCDIHLLVPVDEYERWIAFVPKNYNNEIIITPGDSKDVFSRYAQMVEDDTDYILRLTGDCPFLPQSILGKAIYFGIINRIDYLSNVDPTYRTMPDGYDFEVISIKAFKWLKSKIYVYGDDSDREHVTTYIRKNFQSWMRVTVMMDELDFSDIKLSLDTKEDYDKLCELSKKREEKIQLAKGKGYGVYEY
jgi:spore coat polysaccharide biosynthesis protein SpsF (cytidylyltransferase family)